MISHFLEGQGLVIEYSPSESRRFGFDVSRLTVAKGDPATDSFIATKVQSSDSHLVIVRAEEGRAGLHEALMCIAGTECLDAGTLVYHRWDVSTALLDVAEPHGVTIEQCGEFDVIADVLRASFDGYQNHYSANPQLAHSVTAVAYEEWASTLIRDEQTHTFVARSDENGATAGFVLMTLDEPRRLAEVVLNAVHPDAQRLGVYSALMRAAARFLKWRGSVDYIYISTQRENQAVLSAWERLGLEPYLALKTYHVTRRAS